MTNTLTKVKKLLDENVSLLDSPDEDDEFVILCNIKSIKMFLDKEKDLQEKEEIVKITTKHINSIDNSELKKILQKAFTKENKKNSDIFKKTTPVLHSTNNLQKEEDVTLSKKIESEMLTQSKKLHDMTNKFNTTLQYDKNVVETTKGMMDKNTKATGETTKTMMEIERMSTWGYLGKSIGIFIVMYIIIKVV